jgi:hypothetical protein
MCLLRVACSEKRWNRISDPQRKDPAEERGQSLPYVEMGQRVNQCPIEMLSRPSASSTAGRGK